MCFREANDRMKKRSRIVQVACVPFSRSPISSLALRKAKPVDTCSTRFLSFMRRSFESTHFFMPFYDDYLTIQTLIDSLCVVAWDCERVAHAERVSLSGNLHGIDFWMKPHQDSNFILTKRLDAERIGMLTNCFQPVVNGLVQKALRSFDFSKK